MCDYFKTTYDCNKVFILCYLLPLCTHNKFNIFMSDATGLTIYEWILLLENDWQLTEKVKTQTLFLLKYMRYHLVDERPMVWGSE